MGDEFGLAEVERMGRWLETDWSGLFVPQMSLPEILIRGTVVYVLLVLMLRVILKRQAGKVALSDLLVITLVAGVCRNPLVKDAYSIPDGLAVVAIVLGWSYALDWLSFHSRLIHKLLHSPPVPLIQNGHILEENLRHELMTENQLRCKLRLSGVKDPAEVAEALMEGNGHVSVIRQENCRTAQPDNQPRNGFPGSADAPRSAESQGPLLPAPVSTALASNHPGNGLGLAQAGKNGIGQIAASESEEALREVNALLNAAGRVHDRLAWHRQQVEAHQGEIARLKAILAEHGLRTPRAPKTGSRAGAAGQARPAI
jgi:uncharacterized membrane protein YcaP (DUF421 family)